MGTEELIKSEVHSGQRSFGQQIDVSHFIIRNHNNSTLSGDDHLRELGTLETDEGGDLLLQRPPKSQKIDLVMHHATSTPLDKVGLQARPVWHGALLLAEYILCHQDQLSDCVALEVAAGTGFAGIVMATIARRVFLTDSYGSVLTNCQRNVRANCHHFGYGCDAAWVRRLDVSCATPTDPGQQLEQSTSGVRIPAARDGILDPEEGFSWQPQDRAELDAVDLILAADIIYDNDLTEEFMCCMERFLKARQGRKVAGPPLRVLVAVEKRINFSLRSMCPTADAYDYWRSLFTAESSCNSDGQTTSACNAQAYALQGRQIPMDTIVQQFNYIRGTDLELWDIRLRSRS